MKQIQDIVEVLMIVKQIKKETMQSKPKNKLLKNNQKEIYLPTKILK